MAKIVIDALGIGPTGGGRSALLTLFEHVFDLDRTDSFLTLCSEFEPSWAPFPNVHQEVRRTGGRFSARIDLQKWLPGFVRREGVDLVHFSKNLGVFGLPCPYIVTVHDLTTLLLAEQHARFDVLYWRLVEPLIVRGAARVVTVSRDTARDVERFYRVPMSAIDVIEWAPHRRYRMRPTPEEMQRVRLQYRLPEHYVLFVGILARKKNLPTLLRAMAVLRKELHRTVPLVVVGRRYPQSEDDEFEHLIKKLDLAEQVIVTGSVPDADLPALYSGADVYILPSLHEGFGIPVLESMACGTPVVTTNCGALPDVAGGAAEIVSDPLDPKMLAVAINRILTDPPFRGELIQKGHARASEFSWEEAAARMIHSYHSILEGERT